jgi:ribonucleoside-triphosphate reductase
VVGYLRPVNQWNEGKVEEFKQRKTFKIGQGAGAATSPQARGVPQPT